MATHSHREQPGAAVAHGHGAAGEHAHAHPTSKTYVQIALILTIITALEVASVYIEAVRPVLVPVLLTLSSLKFALVVLYYMHLKFDPRLYSGIIAGGLSCAATVFIALIFLMKYHGFIP